MYGVLPHHRGLHKRIANNSLALPEISRRTRETEAELAMLYSLRGEHLLLIAGNMNDSKITNIQSNDISFLKLGNKLVNSGDFELACKQHNGTNDLFSNNDKKNELLDKVLAFTRRMVGTNKTKSTNLNIAEHAKSFKQMHSDGFLYGPGFLKWIAENAEGLEEFGCLVDDKDILPVCFSIIFCNLFK